VEVSEQYADGLVSESDFQAAITEAAAVYNPQQFLHLPRRSRGGSPPRGSDAAYYAITVESEGVDSAEGAASAASSVCGHLGSAYDFTAACVEKIIQAHLLRDLFGNLFHPVTASPGWVTREVVELAESIYRENRFDSVPLLAELLEEAGCDNQLILSHCRQPSIHMRGCWAVDLILGKE
jgi:hypothetical protein